MNIPRPDLTMKPDAAAKLAEVGKQLYFNKYGCNGCHKVNDEGGKVGPALDRAGFQVESDLGVSLGQKSASNED